MHRGISSGISSLLLMIPGGRSFYDKHSGHSSAPGLVFSDFNLWSHGSPCCHVNEYNSQSRLAQWLASSPVSYFWSVLPYFTENGVGNIFIHKLLSNHIPFSLTSQLPLLLCAISSCQSVSAAACLWLPEHLTRQCGAEGARVWHSTCLSAHRSPMRLCSDTLGTVLRFMLRASNLNFSIF